MRKNLRLLVAGVLGIAALAVLATAVADTARRSNADGGELKAAAGAGSAKAAVPKARFLSPPGQDVYYFSLAGNARGDVAIVWQVFAPRGHDELWFSDRPAGGSWRRARRLSGKRRDGYGSSLALAPDGTVLFLWSQSPYRSHRVEHRLAVRRPGGRLHSRALPGRIELPQDFAVGPDGTAIAAWTTLRGRHNQVRAAALPPAGSWGPTQAVSHGKRPMSNPQVAFDASGNATIVWERWPPGEIERDFPAPAGHEQYQVRAAVRPAGGRFGPPQLLSNPRRDAISPFLAVGPRGDAAVFWGSETPDFLADRIGYTTRAWDGKFGKPRWLTPPGQGGGRRRGARRGGQRDRGLGHVPHLPEAREATPVREDRRRTPAPRRGIRAAAGNPLARRQRAGDRDDEPGGRARLPDVDGRQAHRVPRPCRGPLHLGRRDDRASPPLHAPEQHLGRQSRARGQRDGDDRLDPHRPPGHEVRAQSTRGGADARHALTVAANRKTPPERGPPVAGR